MDAGVQQGVRRSTTLPTQFQARPSSNGASAANTSQEPSETLFQHPHAKIVKFSVHTVLPKSKVHSARWFSPEIAGTLPWKASSERVVAVGPLVLYSLTQSPVAFFQSGDILLTLRPRSQCWCVDGESRFAICITDDIYRIDLPFETEEDKAYVENMKVALSKVLKYEKTACPFRRGFTVDLPDEPESLIPKGPAWSHIKLRKTRASEPAQALRTIEGQELEGRVESSGQSEEGDLLGGEPSGEHDRISRDGSPIVQDEAKPTIPKRSSHRSVTTPVRQRVADFNASTTSSLQPIQSSSRVAKEKLEVPFQEQSTVLESDQGIVDGAVLRNDTVMENIPSNDAQVERLGGTNSQVANDEGDLLDEAEKLESSFHGPSDLVSQQASSPDTPSVAYPSKLAEQVLSFDGQRDSDDQLSKETIRESSLLEGSEAAPQHLEPPIDGLPIPAEAEANPVGFIPIIHSEDIQSPPKILRTEIEADEVSQVQPENSELPIMSGLEDPVMAPLKTLEETGPTTDEGDAREASAEEFSPTGLVPPPKSESRLTSRRSYGRLSPALPPTNPPGLVSRSLALLLGPPSGLVQVMLEIARRIAQSSRFAGMYRFKLGSRDGQSDELIGRWYKLPGAWISDDDEIDRAMGEDHNVTHESVAPEDLTGESEDEVWSEHSDFDTAPTTSAARDEASATRRRMRYMDLEE